MDTTATNPTRRKVGQLPIAAAPRISYLSPAMKTRLLSLLALGLACALPLMRAQSTQFTTLFTGTVVKSLDNSSSGTDLLTGINGPTDFSATLVLDFTNTGGVFSFDGLNSFSLSVGGLALTANAPDTNFYEDGDPSNLTHWGFHSDLLPMTTLVTGGFVRTEAIGFDLYGPLDDGTDLSQFTSGGFYLYGYSFDDTTGIPRDFTVSTTTISDPPIGSLDLTSLPPFVPVETPDTSSTLALFAGGALALGLFRRLTLAA